MRVQPSVSSGFFWIAERKFWALSEMPRTLHFTPLEVADVAALEKPQIERVSSCEIVSMEDLLDYVAMREGLK